MVLISPHPEDGEPWTRAHFRNLFRWACRKAPDEPQVLERELVRVEHQDAARGGLAQEPAQVLELADPGARRWKERAQQLQQERWSFVQKWKLARGRGAGAEDAAVEEEEDDDEDEGEAGADRIDSDDDW